MKSSSAGTPNLADEVVFADSGRAWTAPPGRGLPAAHYTASGAEARPDPAWNALVAAAPGGDLVQTTAWAATRQRLGLRVFHLRVASAADGTPAGGCMIQYRRVLPGIWIGAIPWGPLMFTERPGAAECVVRELVGAARRLGIGLLIVQPPEASGATLLDAMADAGFQAGGPDIAPSATIRLDLRRSEEEILRAMNTNRRRRVREAMRSGVETGSSDDIEAFHRLHVASARRQGFPAVSVEYLQAQWEVLAPQGMCRLFMARDGGALLAGDWLTSFAGTSTFRFTGLDLTQDTPANRSARTANMWTCILEAKRAGAHRFDFGGFDRESAEEILGGRKPPAGFTESPNYFKYSFGGEITLLPKPQFILTGPLARLMLGSVAQRLLRSDAARRIARSARVRR